MYSDEIFDLMLSDIHIKRIFGGVFARDQLPKHITNERSIIIVNTDRSSGKGEHWVCIYLNTIDGVGEYFDSFGLPPRSNDIKSFLKNNSNRYTSNNLALQPIISETCGYFCYYYAKRKARGMRMKSILRSFRTLRPHYNNHRVFTEMM